MTSLRFITLVAGSLLLVYGLWALRSGWIVSTWARVEYRGSVVYWISVIFLIVAGALNIGIGVRSFFR